MNTKVDNFLANGCMRCSKGGTPECKVHNWTEELKLLRDIILETGLKEELKWGIPCYTYNKKNVLLFNAFKENCTISFMKGSLLNNDKGILQKAGENTQSVRLIRFTSVNEILSLQNYIKEKIFEAIEVEKAGLKVEFKKDQQPVPEELKAFFENDNDFKSAFEALTPGRQRAYLMFFNEAKQSTTKTKRIEKYYNQIMKGIGIHDAYRKSK